MKYKPEDVKKTWRKLYNCIFKKHSEGIECLRPEGLEATMLLFIFVTEQIIKQNIQQNNLFVITNNDANYTKFIKELIEANTLVEQLLKTYQQNVCKPVKFTREQILDEEQSHE